MNVTEQVCLNCRKPVSIHVAAAWPERCPYCHTAPFCSQSPAAIPVIFGTVAGRSDGTMATVVTPPLI